MSRTCAGGSGSSHSRVNGGWRRPFRAAFMIRPRLPRRRPRRMPATRCGTRRRRGSRRDGRSRGVARRRTR
ncbi:hypothetical protein F7R23_33310, partial [Burkholderia diffusa]